MAPRAIERYFDEVSKILSYAVTIDKSRNESEYLKEFESYIRQQTVLELSQIEVKDTSQFLPYYLIHLLKSINQASKDDHERYPDLFSVAVSDMKTLNALLDFIDVQCIYPNLSPGVGLSLEKRMRHASKIRLIRSKSTAILEEIINLLLDIVESNSDVSDVILMGQYSSDILSGLAELAFNPDHTDTNFENRFTIFVNRLDTYTLLAVVSTLISKSTPAWYLQVLTRTLAMVPLTRTKDGVFSLIEFIGGLREDENVSVEKLDRAARLLCSVPKNVNGMRYYGEVCRQLLEIVDDNSKQLMMSATCNIIAAIYRAKPKVIEDFIFKELWQSFCITAVETESCTSDIIVSGKRLSRDLNRVTQLVHGTSPEFVDALLDPVLLRLWGLLCFQSRTKKSPEQVRTLILVNINTSGAVGKLEKIIMNILYDGEDEWTFGHGDSGDVALVHRKATYEETARQIFAKAGLQGLENLEQRLDLLLGLIDETADTVKRTIFLNSMRRWLARRKEDDVDPFEVFMDLRLLENILEKYKSQIIRSTSEVISLVSNILQEYVGSLRDFVEKPQEKVSIKSEIGNIVNSKEFDGVPDSDDEESDEEEASTNAESVTIALSLLNAIISGSHIEESERELNSDDQKIISSFIPLLDYISNNGPESVASSSRTLSMLLSHSFSSNESIPGQTKEIDSSKQQYREALMNLQDELIPIRAHGLHILRTLILNRDNIIDVDTVLQVYLATLNDEDSFIYLNSIKGLQALTDLHGIRIVRMLIEEYTNHSQSRIDQQLRVGEALLRTVQRLGEALNGENSRTIIVPMLQTASNKQLDWRIRSSALSIIGMACEVNPRGIEIWVEDCISCALGVLTFETGDDKAPLRRAAVVIVGSLLKGVSGLHEIPVDFAKQITRQLRYSKATDTDPLVRVQANNSMEILAGMITTEFDMSRITPASSILNVK
ncbi:hypothetical protein V1511DRAFT_515913 [Dipodascopsis uninucleata]